MLHRDTQSQYINRIKLIYTSAFNGIPVAYNSKKLNNAQQNYPTVDKELLSIVMTLREFRSMLLGAELHIHTDHKNILHIGDSSQRCLCWIYYVDEYGPKLHYVEGSANIVADSFLRLSRSDTPTSPMVGKKHCLATDNNTSEFEDDTPLDNFFLLTEDSKMLEFFTCLPSEEYYLNLPDDLVTDNPLDMKNIKEKQGCRQCTSTACRQVFRPLSAP